MKLELKHIAPYLPYGIGGTASFLENAVFIVNGIVDNKVKGHTKNGNNVPLGCMLNEFKPILHPLSYVTKEIVFENEIFEPVDKLTEMFSQRGEYDWSLFDYDPLKYPFEIISKMLEWHFDVFGLIDAGLAIDINTLK